jgi:7-cyano-7-deazaguanine reductase
MKRPESVEQAAQILAEQAFAAPDVQLVTFASSEFTSVCPMTGQPDFGTVSIEYQPDKKCLESKSVKFYLWVYRNEGAFCESLAARIADDIVRAIAPRRVKVTVTQTPRGGLSLNAIAERSSQ